MNNDDEIMSLGELRADQGKEPGAYAEESATRGDVDGTDDDTPLTLGYYKASKTPRSRMNPQADRQDLQTLGWLALFLLIVVGIGYAGSTGFKLPASSSPSAPAQQQQSAPPPPAGGCKAFSAKAKMTDMTGHGKVTISGDTCHVNVVLEEKASDGGKTFTGSGSAAQPVVVDTNLGVKLYVTVNADGIVSALYG